MKEEIYLVTVGEKNKNGTIEDLENVRNVFEDLGLINNANWLFASADFPIGIDKVSALQAIDLANRYPEIVDVVEQFDLKIEAVI